MKSEYKAGDILYYRGVSGGRQFRGFICIITLVSDKKIFEFCPEAYTISEPEGCASMELDEVLLYYSRTLEDL